MAKDLAFLENLVIDSTNQASFGRHLNYKSAPMLDILDEIHPTYLGDRSDTAMVNVIVMP